MKKKSVRIMGNGRRAKWWKFVALLSTESRFFSGRAYLKEIAQSCLRKGKETVQYGNRDPAVEYLEVLKQ